MLASVIGLAVVAGLVFLVRKTIRNAAADAAEHAVYFKQLINFLQLSSLACM